MLPLLLSLHDVPASPAQERLSAASVATTRPHECRAADVPSVWRVATRPDLARFCALLARADASMSTEPEAALAAASAAAALLPSAPHADVARARALHRLGRHRESAEAFERATSRDRRILEAPLALRDFAAALRLSGAPRRALDVYRRLLPLAGLLPRTSDRTSVLLEAAHTAMTLAAPLRLDAASAAGGARTADAERDLLLGEALGFLREAAREPGDLRLDVALSRALVLDRLGERAQADALLAEAPATEAWARAPRVGYLASTADEHALAALALERGSPREAREAHRTFLAALPDRHPFSDASRARLARLDGANARGPSSPPSKARERSARPSNARKRSAPR